MSKLDQILASEVDDMPSRKDKVAFGRSNDIPSRKAKVAFGRSNDDTQPTPLDRAIKSLRLSAKAQGKLEDLRDALKSGNQTKIDQWATSLLNDLNFGDIKGTTKELKDLKKFLTSVKSK